MKPGFEFVEVLREWCGEVLLGRFGLGTPSSGARLPNPLVLRTIDTVALAMRSKASRQVSAGGHFSARLCRTVVAASTV